MSSGKDNKTDKNFIQVLYSAFNLKMILIFNNVLFKRTGTQINITTRIRQLTLPKISNIITKLTPKRIAIKNKKKKILLYFYKRISK